MSTPDTGDAAIVRNAVDEAKALLAETAVSEAQLDMLVPDAEDMLDARQALGPNAGHYSVLKKARETKRGRPPGARNKRTDDFARYLLGFGQHPALTMMQIQSTAPEVLIEASRQRKVHGFRPDGSPNVVIERLSYEQAQSLRIRCAEGLLPYIESKKPVAVDMTFSGVADLFIEGVTHSRDEMNDIFDGDFTEVEPRDGEQAT